MNRHLIWLAIFLFIPLTGDVPAEENLRKTDAAAVAFAATDWPWWRGPDRNGLAVADQQPPLQWSDAENVLWKSPVPGRGHGSPTVVGDQIFLATADLEKQFQAVLCFDKRTGKQLWSTDVHRGGLENTGNAKSSLASSTVACDGERLFINFVNAGAAYTTALARDGKQLWQTKICDFVMHQGYGSSPAIFQSLVIVSADNKGGGAIAALDRVTGEIVWKHDRPKSPNYASPIILQVAGREQLLFTGCDLVSSYEPLSGKKLWEIEGSTTECVTSTVTDGKLMFTSGGYPTNHISAVRADGSGEVVWKKDLRVYVPSMLVRNGYLYAVTDAGVAICWQCDSGEEIWKQRLEGDFSSSPIFVGEHIFATNENGKTYIFKATPESCEVIAENKLGDESFATPTICGNRIYLRLAVKQDGQRQEMLYCVGKSE